MLSTERLVLRQWRDEDAAPWAALNADAEVMRYFPGTIPRTECDQFITRARAELDERGYGWFAVELRETGAFAGTVALLPVTFRAEFTPATEIGWRLARRHWGCGYASEGARELLRFGFEDLGSGQVVSFTATGNERSQAVMRRIGMVPDPDHPEFDHPRLPEGHRLRRHRLYRIGRDQWDAQAR